MKCTKQQSSPINNALSHPNEVLKAMMEMNVRDAKWIYNLCKNSNCLNSQEFITWQDELNDISVKYE